MKSSLASTSVMELISAPKEIIAFMPSLTIGDAIDVLGHYEIFSAPVIGPDGCCQGQVDYLDLLCKLVQLTSESSDSQVWPHSRNLRPEDLEILMRRANDWTLEELVEDGKIKVTREDPFFYCKPTDTVLDALAHFGRGVHHLLIVDDTGKVVNLLSQTDVIRFVAKDVAGLEKLREQTIRGLGLGVRPVFAVRNTDSALDAFYELSEAGVSGGAIINPEGKLVGNFSRYDLKGTQGGTGFKVLSQSIMHYQRKHRVALAQRLVTVNPDMAIGDVVSTMAREKVHRVFAVEGGMYPKGCVTQTDVCRVMYEHVVGTNVPTKAQVKELMKTHISRPLVFPLVFPPQ